MSRREDYTLIGDCHIAARVARDGSIDGLCFPRFEYVALEVTAPSTVEVRVAEDDFPQDYCDETQHVSGPSSLGGPNSYRWRSYRDALNAPGFSVRLTSNGLDSVALLRAFRPNVLVLDPDIRGGGGDGVLAVRDEEPELTRNLVMIVTAGCEPSVLYRLSDYAIDDLIWQPVSSEFLQRRLERLLECSRQIRLQLSYCKSQSEVGEMWDWVSKRLSF